MEMNIFKWVLGCMAGSLLAVVAIGVVSIVLSVNSLSPYIDWVLGAAVILGMVLATVFRLRWLLVCLAGLFLGFVLVWLIIFAIWPGMNYEVGLTYLFIGGLMGSVCAGITARQWFRIWRER